MADALVCFYCSNQALRLCDGKGCDRPLCAIHATTTGSFIACVRGGKRKRRSISDTIDYCPDCLARRTPNSELLKQSGLDSMT